jgi:hypothetical protein
MMTKDHYTLGKGRLYFDEIDGLPPTSLMLERSGTFTMKIDMPPWRMARIGQEWFGRDPIPYLVEYDPQKLLPAPGSNPDWFRRDMLAFIASQLGTPYMTENIFKPSHFSPNEVIDFDGPGTGRHIDFRKLYPDVQTADKAWRHKRAVVAVTSLDFSHIETRVIAAMAIPGVVALQLDIREPFGEIAYNRAVTDAMLSCYIKPGPKPKAVKQNGRPAGYLDHDPTKAHKRPGRKRR